MGQQDQRQQAARAAADPEREEMRRLRDEERRGVPGSAASLRRQRRLDTWARQRLAQKADGGGE